MSLLLVAWEARTTSAITNAWIVMLQALTTAPTSN
jgi:hypothetical protein